MSDDCKGVVIFPAPFYRYAPALLPRPGVRPSRCHRFLRLLELKGKLLRNYTHNVDGLERAAGITPRRLLECHGSMQGFHCTRPSCAGRVPAPALPALPADRRSAPVRALSLTRTRRSLCFGAR